MPVQTVNITFAYISLLREPFQHLRFFFFSGSGFFIYCNCFTFGKELVVIQSIQIMPTILVLIFDDIPNPFIGSHHRYIH